MSRLPDPWPSLLERIKRIEDWMSREGASSKFAGTPLRPQEDGSMAVDARLSVTTGEVQSGDFAPGSTGWHLDHSGNAEFNDLTLRGGIIGNDALTNPVRGDVTTAFASGFAFTAGTFKTLASVTWTVPAGFNQAQIFGLAKVFGVNSTAGLDYLYGRSRIVRVSDNTEIVGLWTPTAVSQSGGSGTSTGMGVGVVGLASGDKVRLEVQGMTGFAGWAADPNNSAEWSGSVSWYRT